MASRSAKRALPVLAGLLVVGIGWTPVSAQAILAPDRVGQWTAPFEEGGSGTPRCVPKDDGSGTDCKPAAQAAAVLPDGRVLYWNGIEGQQNAKGPSVPGLAPAARNDQVRVLDLRSGRPEWVVPSQDQGAQQNPDIKPGNKSYDDPLAAMGVPGRPGDGFVGSTWGRAGLPPHEPQSPPDDPEANDGALFCADLTQLADGRMLLVGGTDWYNEPDVMSEDRGDPATVGVLELEGLRSSSLFDSRTDSFMPVGPMKFGRWYPSVNMGADGRPTVFGGVRQNISPTQLGSVRRAETFDPQTQTWTENFAGPESEAALPLLPRMVLTPDGKFFYTGVGQMFGPGNPDAEEALYALQQSFDTASNTWEVHGPGPLGARGGAFVVPLQMKEPYDEMSILTLGGDLGPPPGSGFAVPFATLTTVDGGSKVTNRMTGQLNDARWYPSGVLLPDGQVLALGGTNRDHTWDPGSEIAIRSAELYDPASGAWTKVASHQRDRGYHNSALLLPDMRVLLGGNVPIASHFGGPNRDQGPPFANNDNDPSFEVYSPPYLFRGPRPSIIRAQTGIDYGERFEIGTPEAGDIESVVLLKNSSPQHITDSDQRNLALKFTHTGDGMLEAVAPPSGKVAPPGYYYLVVLKASSEGPIPSVARMVRVGSGTDETEAVQPYPDDTPAPTGSATPDEDTSIGTDARESAADATRAAKLPPGLPSAAGAAPHGAETTLSAVRTAATRPSPPPLLPVAAILTAGVGIWAGARRLRPALETRDLARSCRCAPPAIGACIPSARQ